MTSRIHALSQIIMMLAILSSHLIFNPGWGLAQNEEFRSLRAEEVQKIVEESLPTWDHKVLNVKEGVDWSQDLDFIRVLRIVGENPEHLKFFPANAKRVGTQDMIVRLDRQIGKVRYISRARAWRFATHAKTRAVDPKLALEVAQNLVFELGLPKEEMTEPRVDTQMAGGAPVGSKTIKEKFEMYRIVTMVRSVNQLPVYGSQARIAVNNEGLIQRAQMIWPKFQLSPDLVLRQRSDVVRQTVQEIVSQEPMADIRLHTVLAYALRSRGDEEMRYVPAIIVSVHSSPTPYQLVIPVAEHEKISQDEREIGKEDDQ